jgi:hypothetical protein
MPVGGAKVLIAAPEQSHAQLKLFDTRGRMVGILYDGIIKKGAHLLPLMPAMAKRRLSSRMYLIVLESKSDDGVRTVTVPIYLAK